MGWATTYLVIVCKHQYVICCLCASLCSLMLLICIIVFFTVVHVHHCILWCCSCASLCSLMLFTCIIVFFVVAHVHHCILGYCSCASLRSLMLLICIIVFLDVAHVNHFVLWCDLCSFVHCWYLWVSLCSVSLLMWVVFFVVHVHILSHFYCSCALFTAHVYHYERCYLCPQQSPLIAFTCTFGNMQHCGNCYCSSSIVNCQCCCSCTPLWFCQHEAIFQRYC